jgi:hypothetical protein
VEHLRLLTDEIDELTAEITIRVTTIAHPCWPSWAAGR